VFDQSLSLMIYTNVEPTNIVSHDEQDIRFLTVSHYYDDNDNMTIKEVTKNVTLLKDSLMSGSRQKLSVYVFYDKSVLSNWTFRVPNCMYIGRDIKRIGRGHFQ